MFKMILLACVMFIALDISFAVSVKTVSRDESIANNTMVIKLLELHRQHCGETVTCGSSEHVEPSESVIPVRNPCCIPCSCLPSCVEHQNCCPFSVNGTNTKYTDMVTWHMSDAYRAGLHDTGEPFLENETSNVIVDPKLLPNVESNTRTKEQCIRAQALYRPNWYIDSAAYMMVTTCPSGFKDEIVNEKCAGMLDGGLRDTIPVTSKLSGLTYKNKHCLLCNEKLRAENIVEWSAEIVSKGAFRWHIFFPSPDFVLDNLIANRHGFGNLHFKPGNEGLTRQCKAYDIITCNQTGLWYVYDDFLKTLCLDGYQLPIMSRIKKLFYTFKNIACFHCNTGRDESENSLSCGYPVDPDQSSTTFSSTLNLGSVFNDDQNKRKVVTAPYIDHDVLQQLQYQGCPNGNIYLLGRCRGIICPRDHYFWETQCVPLYDTLKGLDLHLQIQITPSQAIPVDVLDAFEDGLKQMAVEILDDTIHLERRQFSLWYLPRSKVIKTQYYLLDVYLFSPSNVIGYSAAVEQIKQFYLKLKTIELAVLEHSKIKLNFQFKHGVEQRRNTYSDMGNGQTLKPLMEKEWTLMNPAPYVTISELNWCLRVAFDPSDIEVLGDFIRVRPTGILLYIDQIDTLFNQMYLCVDLFILPGNVKDDLQIDREEKIQTDDAGRANDDADGDMTVADSERGFIVAITLVALIIMLVILYKMKGALKRRQTEESNRLDQTPTDFVELKTIKNGNTANNRSEIALNVEQIPNESIVIDGDTSVN